MNFEFPSYKKKVLVGVELTGEVIKKIRLLAELSGCDDHDICETFIVEALAEYEKQKGEIKPKPWPGPPGNVIRLAPKLIVAKPNNVLRKEKKEGDHFAYCQNATCVRRGNKVWLPDAVTYGDYTFCTVECRDIFFENNKELL